MVDKAVVDRSNLTKEELLNLLEKKESRLETLQAAYDEMTEDRLNYIRANEKLVWLMIELARHIHAAAAQIDFENDAEDNIRAAEKLIPNWATNISNQVIELSAYDILEDDTESDDS